MGETFADNNTQYQAPIGGITDAEAATSTMCDIALADDLRTGLTGRSWATTRRQKGASRCGVTSALVKRHRRRAHLDLLASSARHVGQGVPEMKLLPFEAVSYITDAPPSLIGPKDRGRLETGYHADVVVDPPP